ncbi:MAG: ROK family protein [Limnochordales bacterium]|nr:ROK family protein [Limnochordales bacterium]
MAGAEPWVIAVDVGGTKIATGAVDREGRVLARTVVPTMAAAGPEAIRSRIAESIATVIEEMHAAHTGGRTSAGTREWRENPEAIGMAIPGPMDTERGVALAASNLGWYEFPVGPVLASRFGCPVFLENDANAAALGEWLFGAGRGVNNLLYVTISTGIGSGLVVGGRLHRGRHFNAGEVGHMVLLADGPFCTCGQRGCWEALASGTAIARDARQLALAYPESELFRLCGGDVSKIDVPLVGQAARSGDPGAREILDQAVKYLGIGFSNLINILDPDLVVVGGGVSNLDDLLFPRLTEHVRRYTQRRVKEPVAIVRAQLRQDSGLLGAAAVAWQELAQGVTREVAAAEA